MNDGKLDKYLKQAKGEAQEFFSHADPEGPAQNGA